MDKLFESVMFILCRNNEGKVEVGKDNTLDNTVKKLITLGGGSFIM